MNIDQQKALKLLKEYSGIETKKVNSDQEKEALVQAILWIANRADDQNLGICANNGKEAFKTLENYLKALDYNYEIKTQSNFEEDQPVYLKFSTERMSYSIENYSGKDRGVLMTIFADQNEKIEGTYGYFPLNLFV